MKFKHLEILKLDSDIQRCTLKNHKFFYFQIKKMQNRDHYFQQQLHAELKVKMKETKENFKIYITSNN